MPQKKTKTVSWACGSIGAPQKSKAKTVATWRRVHQVDQQMFASSTEALLAALDSIVGSREITREVIALASGAALTASPHGTEADWFLQVERRVANGDIRPAEPRPIILSSRRSAPGPFETALGVTEADPRASALRHLLDALQQDHGASSDSILRRLSSLAARALSDEPAEQVRKWGTLVRHAHHSLQWRYLANNPDLN